LRLTALKNSRTNGRNAQTKYFVNLNPLHNTTDVLLRRSNLLNNQPFGDGTVVYCMSREQRFADNWSLIFAADIAQKNNQKLFVVFCLVPTFLNATQRQYSFLIEGLKCVERQCQKAQIGFSVLLGSPADSLPPYLQQVKAGILVSDFDPLKIKLEWKKEINTKIHIPHFEVDAHNIVPCRLVSDKQEYAAYTLRPKIKKLLPEFLIHYPTIGYIDANYSYEPVDWQRVEASISVDTNVKPISTIEAGEIAALIALNVFIQNKLDRYSTDRNNPCLNATSAMSAYLHFGHISAQRIALEIINAHAAQESKDAYLEELIIRKELSDNFCFYNSNYDNHTCFQAWATQSLMKHLSDVREYEYQLVDFETANTHDPLWNAAQYQLIETGAMHGYMRMYWAKKIVEWTGNFTEAQAIAIYLNDKYALDGRDPNGYAGIAWSIGGIHDRPWGERPIFGKIRYMNFNGCKRKFDVQKYVENWLK